MQDEGKTGWIFKSENNVQNSQDTTKPDGILGKVSWSASEYISNPKNISWFAMLASGSVALAIVVYIITQDLISVVVIIILGILVGVFAARQPEVLEYHLDSQGVHLGHRFYPYISIKSFSVVQDGAFNYVSLLPLKRFMPPLAIHYAPEDEDKILGKLADYLPYEEHKRDIVESITRRVRF